MKRVIITGLAVMLSASVYAQSLRDNPGFSMFSDEKANKVGDVVTILVVESSQASNNAEKTTNRKSDLGFNASADFGSASSPKAAVSVGSNNGFNGTGGTKTTGMISTKISATIDSVRANGNMVIRGIRKTVINGEEQLVSVKGVVRPIDINPDNSVLSYNISEAEFIFEGKGMIDDAQSPGWFTKFLHWIF